MREDLWVLFPAEEKENRKAAMIIYAKARRYL